MSPAMLFDTLLGFLQTPSSVPHPLHLYCNYIYFTIFSYISVNFYSCFFTLLSYTDIYVAGTFLYEMIYWSPQPTQS